MPGFTFETEMRAARYASMMQAALLKDLIDPSQLTSVCPECGDQMVIGATDEHVVMIDSEETEFVLIACEGYWVMDPRIIGWDRENWQPNGALGDAVTGVHDSACDGSHSDDTPCAI